MCIEIIYNGLKNIYVDAFVLSCNSMIYCIDFLEYFKQHTNKKIKTIYTNLYILYTEYEFRTNECELHYSNMFERPPGVYNIVNKKYFYLSFFWLFFFINLMGPRNSVAFILCHLGLGKKKYIITININFVTDHYRYLRPKPAVLLLF